MKKLALLFVISLSIISCEKEQGILNPKINFKFGYLSDIGGAVHIENYENQDSILFSELDTAFTVSVIESDLDDLGLDRNLMDDLESLEFTIYVNTSQDFEIFNTKNVYSIGRGGGRNSSGDISAIENHFVLPIRKTNVEQDNGKIDIGNENDYIRVSYESKYSSLSKVKTIIINN